MIKNKKIVNLISKWKSSFFNKETKKEIEVISRLLEALIIINKTLEKQMYFISDTSKEFKEVTESIFKMNELVEKVIEYNKEEENLVDFLNPLLVETEIIYKVLEINAKYIFTHAEMRTKFIEYVRRLEQHLINFEKTIINKNTQHILDYLDMLDTLTDIEEHKKQTQQIEKHTELIERMKKKKISRNYTTIKGKIERDIDDFKYKTLSKIESNLNTDEDLYEKDSLLYLKEINFLFENTTMRDFYMKVVKNADLNLGKDEETSMSKLYTEGLSHAPKIQESEITMYKGIKGIKQLLISGYFSNYLKEIKDLDLHFSYGKIKLTYKKENHGFELENNFEILAQELEKMKFKISLTYDKLDNKNDEVKEYKNYLKNIRDYINLLSKKTSRIVEEGRGIYYDNTRYVREVKFFLLLFRMYLAKLEEDLMEVRKKEQIPSENYYNDNKTILKFLLNVVTHNISAFDGGIILGEDSYINERYNYSKHISKLNEYKNESKNKNSALVKNLYYIGFFMYYIENIVDYSRKIPKAYLEFPVKDFKKENKIKYLIIITRITTILTYTLKHYEEMLQAKNEESYEEVLNKTIEMTTTLNLLNQLSFDNFIEIFKEDKSFLYEMTLNEDENSKTENSLHTNYELILKLKEEILEKYPSLEESKENSIINSENMMIQILIGEKTLNTIEQYERF